LDPAVCAEVQQALVLVPVNGDLKADRARPVLHGWRLPAGRTLVSFNEAAVCLRGAAAEHADAARIGRERSSTLIGEGGYAEANAEGGDSRMRRDPDPAPDRLRRPAQWGHRR